METKDIQKLADKKVSMGLLLAYLYVIIEVLSLIFIGKTEKSLELFLLRSSLFSLMLFLMVRNAETSGTTLKKEARRAKIISVILFLAAVIGVAVRAFQLHIKIL